MKRKHPSIGMNEVSEEGGITHEFCKPSDVVKLGDLIWVKLHPSSWWPAQVVDAETVSEFVKPIKRLVREVLVRVYGSYIYLYVDPTESCAEFEKVLKHYDGNYDAILQEALAKDRPRSTKSKVTTVGVASQSTGSTLASAAKCGEKNKSAEKKTAAMDKETSTRLRKRVSRKGKPARKMSESNESGNLGSEVSSPTPVEKTSATNQQSQSTKTKTEAATAFLHSENRGNSSDSDQCAPKHKREKGKDHAKPGSDRSVWLPLRPQDPTQLTVVAHLTTPHFEFVTDDGEYSLMTHSPDYQQAVCLRFKQDAL